MLDHDERRDFLVAAVTVMEPFACARVVQHYVFRRYDVLLNLLRIYVDLEHLVAAGVLARRIGPRLDGDGTNFYWETLAAVLVEPDRPSPRMLSAAAPLHDATGHPDIATAGVSLLTRGHRGVRGFTYPAPSA